MSPSTDSRCRGWRLPKRHTSDTQATCECAAIILPLPNGAEGLEGGEDGIVLPVKDGESKGAANEAASRLLVVFENDLQYEYKDNAECATIRVSEAE